MTGSILAELFPAQVRKLITELEAYRDEKNIWSTSAQVSNSAGNLTLHLIGNLNHFIGEGLGKTGYLRNRDAEFSDKHIPREQLTASLEATATMLAKTLNNVTDEILKEVFPVEWNGTRPVTALMLVHLYGHLNYHLGQVNYHRRLLDH